MTIGGQRVGEFTVGSAASAFLQRGVYLLDGRKGGKRVVLKFFVR